MSFSFREKLSKNIKNAQEEWERKHKPKQKKGKIN